MPPSEATSQYDEFGGAGGAARRPGHPGRAGEGEHLVWCGASRRPSPTDGVGKWLACPPRASAPPWRRSPGAIPFSVLPSIDQTRPPATIGGPGELLASVHSVVSDGGALDVWMASNPLHAGDVGHCTHDGVTAVGVRSAADGRRCELAPDPAEVALVQQVGRLRLADLEGGPVGKQRRRRRSQVVVVRVVRGPIARGEELSPELSEGESSNTESLPS